jgi:N,N-dimethylformamidase
MGLGERIIHGYGDRLSVAPGEGIEFKISSEQDGLFRADVVRLISGDVNPAGPGLRELEVDADVNGTHRARFQRTDPGSYVVVEDGGALALTGPFTLHAFICPTTPAKPEQVIIGRFASEAGVGYAMTLAEGRLGLRLGGGRGRATVEGEGRLQEWCWYSVAVSFDPARRLARVYCRPVITSVNSRLSPIVPVSGEGVWEREIDAAVDDCGAGVVIGGCWTSASSGIVDAHFNGKIDSPHLWARALSVQALDMITAG